MIQARILADCNITGGGLDNLRWRKPVRPGTTLHVETEVTEVRASKSRPDRGTLRMHYKTIDQTGDVVLECDLNHIVRRRPSG